MGVNSVSKDIFHPDLQEFIEPLESFMQANPPLGLSTLETARKGLSPFAKPPSPKTPYTQKTIAGSSGHPDVNIYIINAKAGSVRPVILHMHGGGFVLGTAKEYIAPLQDICEKLDCVAVTVDYRLAPETTYIGSVEDNYAALKWVYNNSDTLGIDPKRIALMGESAGGGHAALLAILARDRAEVPICFQCLTYPMLDDRTGTSRPVEPHIGTLIWTAAHNKFGWESFLGTKAGGTAVPKGSVPARVEDLKGLPPAFIGVGSLDLFIEENKDYAKRLNLAGVSCELLVAPGAFHGFDFLAAHSPLGQQFNDARLNALKQAFA